MNEKQNKPIDTADFSQTADDYRQHPAGISASLSQEKVDVFDRELQELLMKYTPLEPYQVPHRVFAV